MGAASIQSDHGDSRALILKVDTLEPVGIIESNDKAYPELTYFFKLSDMPQYNGVFCPLSVPENSNDQNNRVLESILPDALFSQLKPITNLDIYDIFARAKKIFRSKRPRRPSHQIQRG